MTKPQRCGTCRFLDVKPDARGRVIARNNKSYRCLYEITWPPLPDSVTKGYGFRLPDPKNGSWVAGDAGETCPTWQAWPPQQTA